LLFFWSLIYLIYLFNSLNCNALSLSLSLSLLRNLSLSKYALPLYPFSIAVYFQSGFLFFSSNCSNKKNISKCSLFLCSTKMGNLKLFRDLFSYFAPISILVRFSGFLLISSLNCKSDFTLNISMMITYILLYSITWWYDDDMIKRNQNENVLFYNPPTTHGSLNFSYRFNWFNCN